MTARVNNPQANRAPLPRMGVPCIAYVGPARHRGEPPLSVIRPDGVSVYDTAQMVHTPRESWQRPGSSAVKRTWVTRYDVRAR